MMQSPLAAIALQGINFSRKAAQCTTIVNKKGMHHAAHPFVILLQQKRIKQQLRQLSLHRGFRHFSPFR